MLQTIREHTQGWIAGTIISLIILSFAFWGIHSYFTGDTVNNVVANVNGVEINHMQLTTAYERLRRQQTNPNAIDEAALKKHALNTLIDIEVLKQASIRQGFGISDNQVDAYLQGMPEFQVDNRFSLEKFQEFLSSAMLSTSDFLELIRTSLLIDQPKLGIVFTSFALPGETDESIALVNQERDLAYINLPLSYFLNQPIAIPAEKIKAYYTAHQQAFMSPEQVSVEYLEVTLPELAAKLNPTETELKNFYNDNLNTYTQAVSYHLIQLLLPVSATATAEDIKQIQGNAEKATQALKSGEDANKIAKQFHATIDTKNAVTSAQLPVELQSTVSALTKPNQVSEPVKVANGFVIIKLIEMNAPKIQVFDEVKDKVKQAYVRQRAEEKFAETKEQLANTTYEHPESLQNASEALNLPIQSTPLFSKEKSGNDIAQYKKVRDIAFSNDVLNLQNNSDVIQLTPEAILVLRVKQHVSSHLLPLQEVSTQIETILKTKIAEENAEAFALNIKNKLAAEENPTLSFANHSLNWTKTGFIGRYSTKVDVAILDKAFSLPHPDTLKNKTIYGVTRLANGYAIVALYAVKPGVITDPKEKAIFAEQVQRSDSILEYQLYKLSVTKAAKIKITQ